ncbi:hypothetical protein L596_021295 [Steinernema carpocapsae]|uniref:Cytochrome P450 n=1 Tax=Steinernema carpocapsae TaxID=34508 RepID=A0A4U5MIB6_STECR|nr:hypothetical protein L596_021295 [Steinernema carpocapsae]
MPLLDEMREGLGVIMSEGDLWLEHRRFALRTLRDFGLGKNMMQEKILYEYHRIMDPFDDKMEANGGKFKTNPKKDFLALMIGSIINRILVGYSFDETNMDEFWEIRRELDKSNELFSFFDFVIMQKGIEKLPFIRDRHAKLMKSNEESLNFAKRQIAKRRKDIENGNYYIDEVAGPKDFLDAFLIEMEKRKESQEELGTFTDKQLAYMIVDLWQAGMEATILTNTWGFLYLLKNPEVQEKMRQELHNVVGKDRDVELGDRQLLPYCNAVINEVHRMASLLTLNALRRNTRETTIDGQKIPPMTDNAVVMVQQRRGLKNPQVFNPERGKRSCLGEGLARAELFLVLLNIFKSYRLIDDGDINPNWPRGKMTAFVRLPVDYECIFEKV